MTRLIPHIGLRTVKTGLAVALALFLADLRGSPSPIFAGIGAIVATSRTLGDAVQSCLTQFCGILPGAGFGGACLALFGAFRYAGIGFGIVGLILLCVRLRLQFAVPLACIVFVSICLSPANDAFAYGANRLLDTAIGLATALALNIAVKPYNNRARIGGVITAFLRDTAGYVDERVLRGRYPDLSPLEAQAALLSDEIGIFEQQNVFRGADHAGQAVYLRGCEQLARTILQELSALCAMNESGRLSPENAARLKLLGLSAPADMISPPQTVTDTVAGYHLDALLRAWQYLSEFSAME